MLRYPVRVGQLSNGMMFYAQPGSRVNLSAIGVRVGSIHTPKGKVGLPHIVEHLLLRHSSKYTVDEINLMLLEYCGPPDARNIRIDHTSTVFGHDMLAKQWQMRKMFGVFADLLESRTIDANSIAVEKAAIHNEYWLRGKDVVEAEVWDMLRSLVFKKHPAGIRTDAEIPDLKAIQWHDIMSFIRRHYVASNMFAVVFGPSYKEVSKLVEKTFGHWPKRQPPKFDFSHYSEFKPLRRRLYQEELRGDIHQNHVGVGFRTEGYLSKDAMALDVLAEIWHHRLVTRLREDNREFYGGAYHADTLSERTLVHGLLGVQFATVSREFSEYGRRVILEEAARLAESLPAVDVFRAAKGSLRNRFRCSWGNEPLTTCELVIGASCNGDSELIELHNYLKSLEAVNRHEIRRVAEKYFQHQPAITVIRPSKQVFKRTLPT